MTSNGYRPYLFGMMKLPVAAPDPGEPPAIFFQAFDQVPDLHGKGNLILRLAVRDRHFPTANWNFGRAGKGRLAQIGTSGSVRFDVRLILPLECAADAPR